MGDVIGISGERIDPLEEILRAQLHATGSATDDIDALTVTVSQWRRSARAAARSLHRPVKTLTAGQTIHAILTDWPANDREREIHQAALRAAVHAATLPASSQPFHIVEDHDTAADAPGDEAEPQPEILRGAPLILDGLGRWEVEIDLDFTYRGEFTVRGTNHDAYVTADSLRDYAADHSLSPHVVLVPEQDPSGQFVPDRVHAYLILVAAGEIPDHRASDYIGEVHPRTARNLYLPMVEALTQGILLALPARIPRVLPVGPDRAPVLAVTVNPRRSRARRPGPEHVPPTRSRPERSEKQPRGSVGDP